MIDWLTLRLDLTHLTDATRDMLKGRHDTIIRLSPDGELKWQISARESIRSDSHQITVRACSVIEIAGSPARLGSSNNVFGNGDPSTCAQAMITYVQKMLNVDLPHDLTIWKCTRIDVALNFDLGSNANVRQALNTLRHTDGGRYQVRTCSESVYWSPGSQLRSGKAYDKGAHAIYQTKKGQAEFTEHELKAVQHLFRLELKLGSQYWREAAAKPWHQHTEHDLEKLHYDYFGQFISELQVIEMENLLQKLIEISPTPGQARAAHNTWLLIRETGLENIRQSIPKATWHRHKKLLFAAGLGWADFHSRNVVQLRRKPITLQQPVRSWLDIAA